MSIELTGHDLDRDQIVRVARHGTNVTLAGDADDLIPVEIRSSASPAMART